jgi:hypothetical protein
VSPIAHGHVQYGELLFDAAVKPAVVLVAPAGYQQETIGEPLEKGGNGSGARRGVIEEVQAELQKHLSRGGLTPGVVQETWYVRQAQRDTNPREQPDLRHC